MIAFATAAVSDILRAPVFLSGRIFYGEPVPTSPENAPQNKEPDMAKMRHIAIIVPDPEQSARFFEQAFDMKRAGTARRGI